MMLYRLGRDLGIWDIDTLGDVMGSHTLDEWVAFYNAEAEMQQEARIEAETHARLTAGR